MNEYEKYLFELLVHHKGIVFDVGWLPVILRAIQYS